MVQEYRPEKQVRAPTREVCCWLLSELDPYWEAPFPTASKAQRSASKSVLWTVQWREVRIMAVFRIQHCRVGCQEPTNCIAF